MERRHLRCQVRLVSHGARHAAEKRGDFGSRLREAEDVVDEEEHVAALFVAEVLRHRQAGKRNAQTRSRWLVHLPEHHHGLVNNA